MDYVKSIRKSLGNAPLILTGGRVILQNKHKEILLHKRTDFKDTWSLPGGIAELGESIDQTILREVKEETGLVMTDFQPIGFSSNPTYESFEYPNGDKVQLFAMLFHCTEWEGNLVGSASEGEELYFFSINALPKMRENELHSIAFFRKHQLSQKFMLF